MPERTARPYRPRLAASYWEAIGPFVSAAVEDVLTQSSTYTDRELYAAATPLCLWAWQSAGMALDRDEIFRVSSIDRFAAIGMPGYRSSAGKNTIRSRLLRMGEILRTPTTPSRQLRPLGNSDPTAPYSPSELIELRSWARAQSTPARRRNAQALLALGLGAGLSGKEILAVQADDVITEHPGIRVVVRGPRAREVVVLARWEDGLADLSGQPQSPVFRSGRSTDNENLITDFVSRSRGRVHVQARRMRATWLVHHLESGTPMTVLLAASGVATLEALDRFMRFVPKPDPGHATRALRGAGG